MYASTFVHLYHKLQCKIKIIKGSQLRTSMVRVVSMAAQNFNTVVILFVSGSSYLRQEPKKYFKDLKRKYFYIETFTIIQENERSIAIQKRSTDTECFRSAIKNQILCKQQHLSAKYVHQNRILLSFVSIRREMRKHCSNVRLVSLTVWLIVSLQLMYQHVPSCSPESHITLSFS